MSEIRKSLRLKGKRIRENLVVSPLVAKSSLTGCTFDLIPGLSQESPLVKPPRWKRKNVRKSAKNLGCKFVESSYVDTPIALIDTSSLRESEVTLIATPVLTESLSDFSEVAPQASEPVVHCVFEPIVDLSLRSVVIEDMAHRDLLQAVEISQSSPIDSQAVDISEPSLISSRSVDIIQPSPIACHHPDSDDSYSMLVESKAVEERGDSCATTVQNPNLQTRIFKEVDRNLLDKCMNDGENPSVRNDNWLRNRFDLWKRETNHADSKSIEDYEIEELANLMTHFFLALCKDSGERYPSGSIGNLYNSLNRILRRAQKKRIRLTKVNEVDFSLRKCVFFDTVTRAVEASMKLSIDSGANKPRRKAKVISFAEEALILAHESHQMHHPRGLQKRIAWYCTVVFLIRGYEELHNLEYKNFKIKINPINGKKFVEYTEGTSKNHKATVTKFQQEQFRRPVMSYDEDVVACWEKYDSHLASDMKSGAFFLGALDDHRTNVWFKRTNVGLGTIRTWVKDMAKIAGVFGDVTNKSGRATAITRMSLAGVPKHVICGVTGHKNPNMLDRYDATLDLEHEAAQRASRKSFLGSSSMSYNQCRESTIMEYRQLQIAPVATTPAITDNELSVVSHPRVTNVISDVDLWSRERNLSDSNPSRTVETPLHELLQLTPRIQAISNVATSNAPRQILHSQNRIVLPSIPEDTQVTNPDPSVVSVGDRNMPFSIRPYGQYRRIPPQFVRGKRIMDRPNPYSRSQPLSSSMMPPLANLRNNSTKDCLWKENDQVMVAGPNTQQCQMSEKFPVARPVCSGLKRNSVEINASIFSPDEELLKLYWDGNSLSKRSTSSSSSLTNGVQVSNVVSSPVVSAPLSMSEGVLCDYTAPTSVVPPIATTPSPFTKGIQEVVPYIEHAKVASVTPPSAVVTATSDSVFAPTIQVPGGSTTLAPTAVPFSNVTHVNFVFTKEMDFGALMAALGK